MAVQDLIRVYGSGRDESIRGLVLRLYHYVQTRADAEHWLEQQIESFSTAEPTQWREWFAEAISNWRDDWLAILESLKSENLKAAECLEIVKKFPKGKVLKPDSCAESFQHIVTARSGNYPKGKTVALRKPLEGFLRTRNFWGRSWQQIRTILWLRIGDGYAGI